MEDIIQGKRKKKNKKGHRLEADVLLNLVEPSALPSGWSVAAGAGLELPPGGGAQTTMRSPFLRSSMAISLSL